MAELRLERLEMEISSLAASQEQMLKEMREMFAAMNAKFNSLLASETLKYRENSFNQYKNCGGQSKNCSGKRHFDAFIGVNIGTILSNMPSPTKVVALLKSQQIPHVRLYDADHAKLMALANTGIRIIVSVPNNELFGIGKSNVNAANWVARNVVAHVPATNINAIAIGSEVPTSLPNAALVLVCALQFIHSALATANLDSQIKVSAPHSLAIILDSFPPSQAFFNHLWNSVLVPMPKFLESTNSTLLLNVYPYYDYMQSNGIVMSDDLILLTLKKILNRRMVKQKYRQWKFLYNRKEKIMTMPCGFHFRLLRNVAQISTLRTRLVQEGRNDVALHYTGMIIPIWGPYGIGELPMRSGYLFLTPGESTGPWEGSWYTYEYE